MSRGTKASRGPWLCPRGPRAGFPPPPEASFPPGLCWLGVRGARSARGSVGLCAAASGPGAVVQRHDGSRRLEVQRGRMLLVVLASSRGKRLWMFYCSLRFWFGSSTDQCSVFLLLHGPEDPLKHIEGRRCPTARPLEELRGSKMHAWTRNLRRLLSTMLVVNEHGGSHECNGSRGPWCMPDGQIRSHMILQAIRFN